MLYTYLLVLVILSPGYTQSPQPGQTMSAPMRDLLECNTITKELLKLEKAGEKYMVFCVKQDHGV